MPSPAGAKATLAEKLSVIADAPEPHDAGPLGEIPLIDAAQQLFDDSRAGLRANQL